MIFDPYVYNKEGKKTSVIVRQMTTEDAKATKKIPRWQTSWTSRYVSAKRYEKYAVVANGKVIALGMYEVRKDVLVVHILYIEAHPASNPVIVGKNREFYGIGRLLVAWGIKLSIDNGFHGDVLLEAKTPKLAKHYEEDFGAVRIPSVSSGAPRYIIADNAARDIFVSYLK